MTEDEKLREIRKLLKDLRYHLDHYGLVKIDSVDLAKLEAALSITERAADLAADNAMILNQYEALLQTASKRLDEIAQLQQSLAEREKKCALYKAALLDIESAKKYADVTGDDEGGKFGIVRISLKGCIAIARRALENGAQDK